MRHTTKPYWRRGSKFFAFLTSAIRVDLHGCSAAHGRHGETSKHETIFMNWHEAGHNDHGVMTKRSRSKMKVVVNEYMYMH
jgi:hypothetical protein